MLDRRQVLGLGLVSLVSIAIGSKRLLAEGALPGVAYVSSARLPDGSYAVVMLAADGTILRSIPLSARGHDIAIDHASRKAVVFGRRPGFFAVAFDIDGKSEPHVFAPEANRHFYGHGAFSGDGRLLYTSENNSETGDGLIGIYDVSAGVRRVGELPSYGIGPHEAILLGDGRTLTVANGGFANEPSAGREPVDLAGMQPSLVFIDTKTGGLLAKHDLKGDVRLLSLRHLVANAKGDVWFGGQWQGGLEASPELIGSASRDREIRLIAPPDGPQGVALKGYIGSVAMSRDQRILAASAPRAGRILYWDTETGRAVHTCLIDDGCGIAPVAGEAFAISSGRGVMRVEDASGAIGVSATAADTEFDNHLRFV